MTLVATIEKYLIRGALIKPSSNLRAEGQNLVDEKSCDYIVKLYLIQIIYMHCFNKLSNEALFFVFDFSLNCLP